MIRFERVTKRYGPRRGVEDVSFEVRRGEIVGLLGPNGAGKTTTLRMLTGYLPPSEGRILVDGHDVEEEPFEARRRIGYMPDNPPLYPEMTVRGYLQFVAALRDVPARSRAAKVDAALERFNLGDVAGRLIGRLSRGYRQRVGLAQAVVHDPDVLVLDEPTVGLDPRQVSEMRETIRALARDHTIVFSSHILSEVQALCERVVILHEGRVVAEDRPESLARALESGETLFVEVAAEPERAEAVLRGVPGVAAVTPLRPRAAGAAGPAGAAFRLQAEPGRDVREALFYRLADARMPLLALQRDTMSLEEVFLKLTQEEEANARG
ncbi:MAG: ABC transporter ATP-binding protein [Clostridia bacterium]|nr:ABC transporter ATP-binding protein [Clostridia bacterium]